MLKNDREVLLLTNLPVLLAEWRARFTVLIATCVTPDSPDQDFEMETFMDPLEEAVNAYFRAQEEMKPWVLIPSTIHPRGKTWLHQISMKVFITCLFFSLTEIAERKCRNNKEKGTDMIFFSRAWEELNVAIRQDREWGKLLPSDPAEVPSYLTKIFDRAFTGKSPCLRLFLVFRAWTAFALELTNLPFYDELEDICPRPQWRADPDKMLNYTISEWTIGEFSELNKIHIAKYATEPFLNSLTPDLLFKFIPHIFWHTNGLFEEHFRAWRKGLEASLQRYLPLLTAWKNGSYIIEIDLKKKQITNILSKKSAHLSATAIDIWLGLREKGPISLSDLYKYKLGHAPNPDQIHRYFIEHCTAPIRLISAQKLIKKRQEKKNIRALYFLDPSAIVLIRE